MKSTMAVAMTLLAGAKADEMNPLSKVISLMDELAAKITKEGESEGKVKMMFQIGPRYSGSESMFGVTSKLLLSAPSPRT